MHGSTWEGMIASLPVTRAADHDGGSSGSRSGRFVRVAALTVIAGGAFLVFAPESPDAMPAIQAHAPAVEILSPDDAAAHP